jgi:predicted HAD superfamily Cof-like phosphohydrolase
MVTSYEQVKEFHEVFGHPVGTKPEVPNDDRSSLRIELIREELCELMEAAGFKDSAAEIRAVYINPDEDYQPDIVGIADALGDLDYVVNGAALECGIDLPRVTAEVHRSNMTKLGTDGKPIYREDGKILKGEGYEPPNLEKVLFG